ncbi:MAG: peptide deformylase [Cyanobacteria bacterium SZAS LIN-2]|nr:peptide deformylase [Cyanobacteria bacterium SZAS LIN-3]MBS1996667.1 peptide deformylase [Cyanobacteria bacterium SZAS LIN-2]MBS2008791.1 peptide deformylase [Cyanobacteria bacterium SZAS TMP-1]
MAVREVLVFPDARLKEVSAEVDIGDYELKQIIQDLQDTLEASPGCTGIAAPQLGIQKRIVLIDATRARKPNANHGRVFLINPVIESSSGSATAREGCLSVPDLTGNVTRAESITVDFVDMDGVACQINATAFEARLIQHEVDHLDGYLFIDRVSCLKTDVFRRKRYEG